MEPLISIIIITLNEENYLPLLLDDLVAQTDKRFEVIIVDAKSQDRTKEVSLRYKDKLHLQFVESPRGQVSFQRNLGTEYAKCDYFFFLDADSRVEKDVIAKLLKHITTEKKSLYLPVIQPSKKTVGNNALFWLSVQLVKFLHIIRRPMALGPLIVMHKALFTKIRGFDEKVKISEDHNIVIRAVKAGHKATFLDDVPVVYSMRRFEAKGKWNLIKEYAKYTFITLFKGGVYESNNNYIMGGQQYKKKSQQ